MIKFIIVVGVIIVSEKVVKLKLQTLNGRAPATRKNPHATAVGLGLDFQHSSWCIMWMATWLIAHPGT